MATNRGKISIILMRINTCRLFTLPIWYRLDEQNTYMRARKQFGIVPKFWMVSRWEQKFCRSVYLKNPSNLWRKGSSNSSLYIYGEFKWATKCDSISLNKLKTVCFVRFFFFFVVWLDQWKCVKIVIKSSILTAHDARDKTKRK